MKRLNFKRLCILASLFVTSTLPFTILAESSVWKVSKGGNHIFIGGTIHILPPAEFPLPKEFEQAYKLSDTIVLEAELPDESDTAFQMKMMKQMAYSDGTKIANVITKKTYKNLKEHFVGLGVDIKMFEHFKPGFLVTVIALLEAQKAGFSGEGVDIFYSKKATMDNKKLEYFESVEFQMNMIERLGKGSEDSFIQTNLEQMKDFDSLFAGLLSAWRTGDERKLIKLAITPMESDPKSLKVMLTDRNRNWIKDIVPMFSDNDREFILVGVAHLIGKNSVLNLLKAKGYRVEKL